MHAWYVCGTHVVPVMTELYSNVLYQCVSHVVLSMTELHIYQCVSLVHGEKLGAVWGQDCIDLECAVQFVL